MSAPGGSALRTEACAREPAEISEFGFLQIRPLVLSRETEHDSHRFERGHSQEVARLVAYFNAKFAGENAPAF
ncbi:MAG TPA: hypothetical protein VJ255_18995 [Candidatus Acidoferrum sp.]|nr:hypothetical protein [Candidatus Acidoferrum sp.]